MIRTELDKESFSATDIFNIGPCKIMAEIGTVKNKRDTNEDNAIVIHKGKVIVAAVCDGLGGHMNGELASKEVIDLIGNLLDLENLEEHPTLRVFDNALFPARDLLRSYGYRDNRDTTCVVAVIQVDRSIDVYNIGDSRAFIDGPLRETEPQGEDNCVSHTVRSLEAKHVGYYPWAWDGNEFTLVLASDGVDTLSSQECLDILNGHTALELCERAAKLGSDNATAIMIKVTKCS